MIRKKHSYVNVTEMDGIIARLRIFGKIARVLPMSKPFRTSCCVVFCKGHSSCLARYRVCALNVRISCQ